MKTTLASLDRSLLEKIETLGAKTARIMIDAVAAIVNKFFQELEAAQDRDALRRLTHRQLDDIGLAPFDRDRLLS